MDERIVDLVVVGGGLAGLPFAIACAEAGLKVAVVDRERPEAMLAEPFDGRTTALAYAAGQMFQVLGLWDGLARHAEPILDIRIADQGSPLFLHYDHTALGDDPLGWVVENRHIRRVLAERIPTCPNLIHLAPATVERLEAEEGRITARLADGGRIRASLAVAADGKRSALREAAGIKTLGTRYGQDAITFVIAHERPHGGVAVEHFLPGGPFAMLPLPGNRTSIVWSERSALVPGLMALDESRFHAEVARRLGAHLGAFTIKGPRWSYPLEVMLAERFTAPRLALLGEAAHVIHPIAGQGLNLSLRDAAALAELVVDAARLGLDPGAPALLARYARWRRVDTVSFTAVTDGLNRLFSNAIPPVRLVRDLGLAAVERVPPLKRLFMRHAMGVLGDLPRLAQGRPL
jgi:2-octaprenyl-6-methoxyphenol hydroxylase